MDFCGPSCCSKIEVIFQMLLRNNFYTKSKSVFYFNQQEQQKFSSLERNLNFFSQSFLDLISFHSWKTVCWFLMILVRRFSKLATAGLHRNISVIYVKHNLFQQNKWSRTIDLNPTHIILFKSPRGIQQITYTCKQLNNKSFLNESCELAKKYPLDTYSSTWVQQLQAPCAIVQILYNKVQHFFIYLPPKQL